MTYRDEAEAQRQRIEVLETDLTEARAQIEALETELGRRHSGVPELPKGNAFLGAPTRILAERLLAVPLTESLLETIVSRLREGVGELGSVQRVGRLVAWSTSGQSGRMVEVTIEPTEDGGTRIRITERLAQLAGGLFGGVVGGAGGGGLGLWLPLTAFLSPAAIPFVAVGWVGLVYGVVRNRYRAMVQKRHDRLHALADAIETAARRVHVRVEENAEPIAEAAEPAAEELSLKEIMKKKREESA